jgi:hypothetical protein
MTRAKLIIKNIMIVLFSTLVGLIIVEVFLRVIPSNEEFVTNLSSKELKSRNIEQAGFISETYWEKHAVKHGPMANMDWSWLGHINNRIEYFIDGHWNNLKCNDNIDYVKKMRERNILIMGDSFIEALQVPPENNIHHLLNSKVDETGIWFYGCGVSGFSPRYAYKNLSDPYGEHFENLLILNPDEIIYFVYLGNDLSDETRELSREGRWAPLPNTCLPQISYDSKLEVVNLLIKFINKFSGRNYDGQCADYMFWPYLVDTPDVVDLGWESLENNITKIQSLSKKNNIEFKVVYLEVFPVPYGQTEFDNAMKISYGVDNPRELFDLKKVSKRFSSFLKSKDIKFINASKLFSKYPENSSYYLSDKHLNVFGHKLIADEIALMYGFQLD